MKYLKLLQSFTCIGQNGWGPHQDDRVIPYQSISHEIKIIWLRQAFWNLITSNPYRCWSQNGQCTTELTKLLHFLHCFHSCLFSCFTSCCCSHLFQRNILLSTGRFLHPGLLLFLFLFFFLYIKLFKSINQRAKLWDMINTRPRN